MQVNPEMVTRLENAGLTFTGKDGTGQRMEVANFAHDPLYIFLIIVVICIFMMILTLHLQC